MKPHKMDFKMLRDPSKLNDWQQRFKAAGSQDAKAAWRRILSRELDSRDHQYLTFLLERETVDTFVPPQILHLFELIYHAFILKEYVDDPKAPRAPFVLVVGNSGSGKSATVQQAIEQVFFTLK